MTIAIILSTHGSASNQLLKTTELIVGKQKNIKWVDLLPEENTEILIQKYSKCLLELNTKHGVLFLIDTWGGSPFNAANQIILNKKNYDIITGINIPMLIEICISREDTNSIEKLVKIALKCGKNSIKSVNYSINNNLNLNAKKIKNTTHDVNTVNPLNKKHMTICLVRIDDRLIHGQVVTRWVKEYNIQRIIVVNDKISQDMIRVNLMKNITPPGITAHIINIDKMIRVYNNPKYAREKVIMLFTNPTDIVRIVEKGIPITSVNIGGMAYYQGKTQIYNTISVNNTDITAFKTLDKYKIKLEIRTVPSDSPLDMMKLIEKIKKPIK